MYRIVASDLDGTLLTPDHIVAPFTRDTLQRLYEKGEHFIFATGRHHVDVAYIRKSVGIPAFMITSNGARVHDADNNLVFSHDIQSDLVPELIMLARNDEDVSIHLYHEDNWLVNREAKDLTQSHKESGFQYTLFDINNPPLKGIAKLFYLSDNQKLLLDYEHKLKAQFGKTISVAFSTPQCLEVMGTGVSKGAALEAVAKLKGYSLNECIAFGDGMNDVEMLLAAKKGLVMAGAPQRVKDTLSDLEVIGSNKDEAVAHYLSNHLL